MNPFRRTSSTKYLFKQDISEIPFEELAIEGRKALDKYRETHAEVDALGKSKAISTVATEFANKYTLDNKASWLLPQIVAYFGTWIPVRNSNGLFCGKQTIEKNLEPSKNDFLHSLGIYYLVMYADRGSYVSTQYKDPGRNYCKYVPIILLAFKKFQNIKYSQWDRETLQYIVDYDLLEHMFEDSEVLKTITPEQLLNIRNLGLTVKSDTSKRKGSTKSIVSTAKLSGIKDTEIGNLYWLTQSALTQIWCAHPDNRTEDMILDPLNWDTLPPPLLDPVLVHFDSKKFMGDSPPGRKKYEYNVNDSPW